MPDKMLMDLVFDCISKRVKQSGKSREYFEKEVLSRCNPNLSRDEKKILIDMTREILNKAFPN